MRKINITLKCLLLFSFILNMAIYFTSTQKLAIQQAFLSKYETHRSIEKDETKHKKNIRISMIRLTENTLSIQAILNLVTLFLFYIYIKLIENRQG